MSDTQSPAPRGAFLLLTKIKIDLYTWMKSPSRKLKQKFWNKRVNAKKAGIDFKLTLSEFLLLLEQAGVTEEDLNIKGYHLSRYNDTGAYEIGNCRFVHYLENYSEKKISEKARAASRQNLLDYKASIS